MVAYVDPKSKHRCGIICDVCGCVSSKRFCYFNLKFDKVDVDVELKSTMVDKNNLELDVCEKCMNGLLDSVKNQIKKRKDGEQWTAS